MEKTDLIKMLSANSHAQRFRAGDTIVTEGNPATEGLCFVLSGTVRIVQFHAGQSVQVGSIQTGQFFGETALLLDRSRGASAIADSSDVIIMFINRERFLAEARNNYHLIKALVGEAIERIERVIQTLVRIHKPIQIQVDPTLRPIIQGNQANNLEIPRLLNHTRTTFVGHEKAVFTQGQRHDGLIYLITEGTMAVQRNQDGQTLELFEFVPGDIFGYSRASSLPFREYTALAKHDTARVIHFDEELLYRLMRLNVELFYKLFRSILTHLLILDDTLRMAAAKGQSVPASAETQKIIATALSEGGMEN